LLADHRVRAQLQGKTALEPVEQVVIEGIHVTSRCGRRAR
jgi:hypothetical protein